MAEIPNDEHIDTTDIPEVGEEFFQKAKLVTPTGDPRMRWTLKDMARLHEHPKVLLPMVKEGEKL